MANKCNRECGLNTDAGVRKIKCFDCQNEFYRVVLYEVCYIITVETEFTI